jgi:AraC-like DNA-binding protein
MSALRNGHHLERTGMNTRLSHIQNWPELVQQANWSVSALADKTGVSTRTLERYILRKFGKSPRSLIAEQRRCRAIELFRHGSNVKETADSLAYQHARDFSRRFPHLKNKSAQTAEPSTETEAMSQNASFFVSTDPF